MLRASTPALLLAAAMLWASGSAAQTPPPDQAIQIEADRMEYDDRRQVNVFTGNVVLVRGTLEIRAERMVLSQDAKGHTTARATGEPANFRQAREGTTEVIEGSGRELRYDDATQELQLIDSARLRKTIDGRLSDEVQGGRITYKRDTDFFSVQGAPAQESNKPGRVRVIIQPRGETQNSSALPLRPAPAAGR